MEGLSPGPETNSRFAASFWVRKRNGSVGSFGAASTWEAVRWDGCREIRRKSLLAG